MSSSPVLLSGQQAGTASAAALPSLPAAAGSSWRITLTALKANGGPVYYGPAGVTTSTGAELAAGASVTLVLNDLALIYIVGNNNTVSWAITAN